MPKPAPKPPVLRLRPSKHYPTKDELEVDVSVDASPEDARAALMRSVRIEETEDA